MPRQFQGHAQRGETAEDNLQQHTAAPGVEIGVCVIRNEQTENQRQCGSVNQCFKLEMATKLNPSKKNK